MTQHHPPTPPAIPNDSRLTESTFALYPETLTFIPEEQLELQEKVRELQLEAPVLSNGERLEALKAFMSEPTITATITLPAQSGMTTKFDPHTMSIGAVSVAALLEDAA